MRAIRLRRARAAPAPRRIAATSLKHPPLPSDGAPFDDDNLEWTAEAADARGVSVNTMRTQIQQALRKADVRSLMDLVRLAASLPRLDERPN